METLLNTFFPALGVLFTNVDSREMLVLGVIAGLVIFLGFFPQVVLNLTDASVDRILSAVQF